MRPLEVGCIVDEGDRSSFVRAFLDLAKTARSYSITLIVRRSSADSSADGFADATAPAAARRPRPGASSGRLFHALLRLERAFVRQSTRYRRLLDLHEATSPLADVALPRIYVGPAASARDPAAGALSSSITKKFDVILHCCGCSAEVVGADPTLAHLAVHGIFAVPELDGAADDYASHVFWAVFDQNPATCFRIRQFAGPTASGRTLYAGAIPTSPFYFLNLLRLSRKIAFFLHARLEDIGRTRELPLPQHEQPHDDRPRPFPSARVQLSYLARFASRTIGARLRRLRGIDWRWAVAFQYVDDWRSAELWRCQIIPNPPQRFLADPFVVRTDALDVVFVEDYDYRRKRGHISAFEVSRKGSRYLGTALQEDFHLSYPYLFRAAGHLFMCPETAEKNEVRLYRCVEFPLKWVLHKIIMRDVSCADTNIFFHGGLWWMLTNMDTSDLGDHGSELHAFFTENLEEGEWTAHPRNPVVFDSNVARNGGMLVAADGTPYRVFQRRGFDVYGAAMGVAEIVTLTTEDYAEQVYCHIEPRFFDGIRGAHSYAFAAGLMAIDFVRMEGWRD